MKTKPFIVLLAVLLLFALAGCVAVPEAPEVSISHPAHPGAARSPLPALAPGLMAGVPGLEAAPRTGHGTESGHEHDSHAAHSHSEEKK